MTTDEFPRHRGLRALAGGQCRVMQPAHEFMVYLEPSMAVLHATALKYGTPCGHQLGVVSGETRDDPARRFSDGSHSARTCCPGLVVRLPATILERLDPERISVRARYWAWPLTPQTHPPNGDRAGSAISAGWYVNEAVRKVVGSRCLLTLFAVNACGRARQLDRRDKLMRVGLRRAHPAISSR